MLLGWTVAWLYRYTYTVVQHMPVVTPTTRPCSLPSRTPASAEARPKPVAVRPVSASLKHLTFSYNLNQSMSQSEGEREWGGVRVTLETVGVSTFEPKRGSPTGLLKN